ncbi:uncharacterized protein LOC142231343 [Haematobia irritans]|uniref:uncharacterized protein LOC142231343 n=1 Tax=Haematobia irritans TaxID=7368 RepID=UPI003F50091E
MKKYWFVSLLSYTLLVTGALSFNLDFKRLVCSSVDANFSRFDLCEVRSNKNSGSSFSITLRLLKGPVKNCIVNTQFYNIQGKQQLLITNRTWDGCKALRSTRKFLPILFLLNLANKYTNMNHTCPYNHTIIVRNATPGKIPFLGAVGNYVYKANFIIDGQRRVAVDCYFNIL